jgi:hypothetical protein
MQTACQRFVKTWLAATILGLATLAALNVLVDPAGAYPGAHLKVFDSVRYLDLDRVTKAEMARHGNWEIIILGSSRSELGFPASHPFLATNKACNLSLAAARFPELVTAFDFACAHNPLKHVILGLDLYMFAEGSRWIESFPESRFNPDVAWFPYYCKRLIGRAATDRTWETIRRKLQGYRPIPQETRGFHNHTLGPNDSQHELFDRVMRILGKGYRKQAVDPAYLELFRHVVRVCGDQHIDLQVAIMPVHALDLELVYAGGRWPELEKWKQNLVEVLAQERMEGKFNLWDFTGYSGPPAEAVPPAGDRISRMKFYFENSHCTPLLGGMMLDEIFASSDPSQFGVKLTRANVREHLARVLADRAAYARTNVADIQWVQRIMSEETAVPHDSNAM